MSLGQSTAILAFTLAKSEARQETGHQELFLMLTILSRVLTSARISVNLSPAFSGSSRFCGVELMRAQLLMVDQVAQAVIVLDLQAGQVHHLVPEIRWVAVVLQASQTTSGVRANVVLVWASSCCSHDLFYYMYEWLPVCLCVQCP